MCKCPIQNFVSFSVLEQKSSPKNDRNCSSQKKRKIFRSTKEQQTETERERERERERKRKREEHRRADVTEKESGEMIKLVAAKVPRLFSSLVLEIRFLDFFFFAS